MRSPFELKSLIDWLEKQPAEHTYNWADCDECLVAQYLRAVTGEPEPVAKFIFSNVFRGSDEYRAVAAEQPYTFGAALERARALPEDQRQEGAGR